MLLEKLHLDVGILYIDHGCTKVKNFLDVDWAKFGEDRRSTSG